MFPAKFDYYRAGSIREAIELMGQHAEAKLLAGGHSLLPMMKLRLAEPSALIDIGRVPELKGICREGAAMHVGALVRHADLLASDELRSACPLLVEAAGKIADPAVRNRGTIGGNVAHADPASDLPAVLVVLGGALHLEGSGGKRRVAAAEFFQGLMTTDLREGELLVGIELPVAPERTGTAYLKVEHPASGYAICGAAAVVTLDGGGKVQSAALCFNGIASVALSADVSSLVGQSPDEATVEKALANLEVPDPLSDLHASAEYRTALARTYGKRALLKAASRAE